MVRFRPPYQAVVRLCWVAADYFGLIEAAHPTLDLLRLPPRKFLNIVYLWVIERIPYDRIAEWQAELVELLPWQDSQSAAAEELESASFMAAYNKK